jgi:predicted protein tyrosine phosphatase
VKERWHGGLESLTWRKQVLKVLFLCTQNRIRSPTAEQIFAKWPGVETDSAGLHSSAAVVLSPEQIAWADLIVVMENRHRTLLSKGYRARLKGKRVVCVDVPDKYRFMDPALIAVLETRAAPFLR